MCCLPFRDIKDVVPRDDELTKDEVKILMQLLKADIQSLTYLERTSKDFVNVGEISIRENIIRKLCLLEV
jgi:hypothetical protein